MKINCHEFYFARHGETDNNALGLVSGSMNVPLNSLGVSQADSGSQFVSTLPIARCVCSPLMRAHDTAMLLLSKTNIHPIPVHGLEERNWGQLEGTLKSELDRHVFSEMGVELWDDYLDRTTSTLHRIDFSELTFLVAHSGTFRVLCEYLEIKIEKKPVLNAWPYRFYRKNGGWHVEVCEVVR